MPVFNLETNASHVLHYDAEQRRLSIVNKDGHNENGRPSEVETSIGLDEDFELDLKDPTVKVFFTWAAALAGASEDDFKDIVHSLKLLGKRVD